MTSDAGTFQLLPEYGAKFLEAHAGRIIVEPHIALVELVANAWDAGADNVIVTWPVEVGSRFAVTDNGTGMTRVELERRWMTLSYDRDAEQGPDVQFPPDVRNRPRKAYGRNGVGRHAMFCFADHYQIETRRNGQLTRAVVTRASGQAPFHLEIIEQGAAEGHGTTVATNVDRVPFDATEAVELLGSRFFTDPEFQMSVNGNRVAPETNDDRAPTFEVKVDDAMSVTVRRFETDPAASRSSKQNGIAWWVNRRVVGAPSWDTGMGPLLDSRRAAAKRFTYVVAADALRTDVKPDWTGFRPSQEVNKARRAVEDFVREDLRSLLLDDRREKKRIALQENKAALRPLPPISQDHIAAFLEEIQVRCPTITEKELSDSAEVLAKLEQARSGYSLLRKLAALQPHDLDGLNAILDEWSIEDAKKVLGELRYRLALIQRLESLVEDKKADELHDLQPLFERGLWIFGPEFETLEFTSNQSLATVIQNLLGGGSPATPRKRPDFVVLPDTSIGVYSRDAYDQRHEVAGLGAVVVVELKKGGFEVSHTQKDQALHYTRELRKSGKVNRTTRITAYVLGATVDPDAEDDHQVGETRVIARAYSTVLRQAHARTFHLAKRVELRDGILAQDEELRNVLQLHQTRLFEDEG
jgi:hypothetical protein